MGLTLVGGSTYLIATRIAKRQTAALREQLENEAAEMGYLSDEEELSLRVGGHKGRRG